MKGILLDTCYISSHMLPSVLNAKEIDFYVTPGIMKELALWKRKTGPKTKKATDSIDRRINHIQKQMSSKSYKEASFYTTTFEETEGLKHNHYAISVIKKAMMRPRVYQLVVDKNQMVKVFENVAELYAPVIDLLDIKIEISNDIIRLGRKNDKKFRKAKIIKGIKDMNARFGDLGAELDMVQTTKEMIKQDYHRFFDGMKIMGYFQLNPSRVLHYRTDRTIQRLSKLTAKSVMGDVYSDNFGTTPLSKGDVPSLMDLIKQELVAACREKDAFQGEFFSLMASSLRQVESLLIADLNNGYIPRNRIGNDANLVTTLIELGKDYDYDSVELWTCDSDIRMIGEMLRLRKNYKNTSIVCYDTNNLERSEIIQL